MTIELTNTNTSNNDDDVAAQVLSPIKITYIPIPLNLRIQINDYLKLKYVNNENAIDVNEQKEIEFIINSGLVSATTAMYSNNSPLLHKEKKPRKDVWVNLGKIASEFINCNSYPIINSNYLSTILNKTLGNRDSRVLRDYRKTILLYCNIHEQMIERCRDTRLGDLDVGLFVKLVPKQYITTSSTSFS